MAYEIPPEFTAELTDWTLHFLDHGDSPELAHEHASAAVAGIYLRDEGPSAVVDDSDELPRLELPPFRWGNVVPLPPDTRRAA